MQIFSMIRSSEQLLNDNQCNGEDYVDINYFITKISTQTMSTYGIRTLRLISPLRPFGEGRTHGPK